MHYYCKGSRTGIRRWPARRTAGRNCNAATLYSVRLPKPSYPCLRCLRRGMFDPADTAVQISVPAFGIRRLMPSIVQILSVEQRHRLAQAKPDERGLVLLRGLGLVEHLVDGLAQQLLVPGVL